MNISLCPQSVSVSNFISSIPLTPQEGAVVGDMTLIYQTLESIREAGGSNISVTAARQLCVYIQELYRDLNNLPTPLSPYDQHMLTTAKELFEGSYSPYTLAQAAALYNPLDPNNVSPMQEAMKTFISSGWLDQEMKYMQEFINNPFVPPT